ncbi:MAG: hypothetical protein JXA95_12255 [Spirochaetales bacterium]|nr:hypothetical protein [Spirochaetales bacterium]
MNGMYMSINFGVGSLIALLLGFLGDRIGLDKSYLLCSMTGIGLIPLAFLLPRSAESRSERE